MSKGLDALKRTIERLQNGEKIIVRDYVVIEKELEAFEIIKKKNVSITMLKLGVDLKTYNMWWTAGEEYWLTQEEYDLLQEVLL